MTNRLLDEIATLFAKDARPTHFTDYGHCMECAEHDASLRRYEREELPLDVLNNPAWDPICFVTPEAFRYLFPRLCELAYGEQDRYYLDQFLFHLAYNIDVFSRAEKDKLYALLLDIVAKNAAEIDANLDRDEIDRMLDRLAQ